MVITLLPVVMTEWHDFGQLITISLYACLLVTSLT